MTSCYYSPLTSSACNSGYRHIYNNLLKIYGKHLYKSLSLEFLSHFQKQWQDSIIMSTICMLDREEHCTNLLLWPELCQLVTDSHLSQLILLTATMEQNHFSAKQKHKCCFKEFQASVQTNIEAKQSGNVVSISSLLKTQRSLASCTLHLQLATAPNAYTITSGMTFTHDPMYAPSAIWTSVTFMVTMRPS